MSYEVKNGKRIKAQIHCPVSGCVYFYGSEKYFTGKKFLNQHIAKVHAEKKYSCSKCQKTFGLDWWRKHHEKTCGIEWKCYCGAKYAVRESLLTHARRSDHKLPDHVMNVDKMKQNKSSKAIKENPVVVLIQPIIQNLTCIQPVQNTVSTLRPILSKAMKPLKYALPSSVSSRKNLCNPIYTAPVISHPTSKNIMFSQISPNQCNDTLTNQFLAARNSVPNLVMNSNEKPCLRTTATQTTNSSEFTSKTRESRASQCSRRKSKILQQKLPVGIESTHTQTAESAVVKIKKRRSRRKSVAITTEPYMLTGPDTTMGHSVWPNFKDLILPNNYSPTHRAFKNSASTQTNVLCDSQTITDDDLFQFVFSQEGKNENCNTACHSPFTILPDMKTEDPLAALQEDILQDKSLSILNNIFTSNNSMVDSILNSDIKGHSANLQENDPMNGGAFANKNPPDPPCDIFSAFSDCNKPEADNKVSPTLSDIHTQTIASTMLELNLLANMETQTTDDFSLYDLEFSDTETQTPWEDFPNIEDPLLQADQLSIEIQTDFPFVSADYNQDPYDFINGLNVQSIGSECSKETLGVNIETQTQDKFSFPEFTNSEAQTLDVSPFSFSTLQSS